MTLLWRRSSITTPHSQVLYVNGEYAGFILSPRHDDGVMVWMLIEVDDSTGPLIRSEWESLDEAQSYVEWLYEQERQTR